MLNFLLNVVNAGVVGDKVNSTGNFGKTTSPIVLWFKEYTEESIFLLLIGFTFGIISTLIAQAIHKAIKSKKTNKSEGD